MLGMVLVGHMTWAVNACVDWVRRAGRIQDLNTRQVMHSAMSDACRRACMRAHTHTCTRVTQDTQMHVRMPPPAPQMEWTRHSAMSRAQSSGLVEQGRSSALGSSASFAGAGAGACVGAGVGTGACVGAGVGAGTGDDDKQTETGVAPWPHLLAPAL